MEQTGEYRIQAGLDEVWAGLNDPEILTRCIDGCQSMEKVSDERFDASVKAKIGPVSATFKAELELTDVSRRVVIFRRNAHGSRRSVLGSVVAAS